MPNKFARSNGNFDHPIWALTNSGVAGSTTTPNALDPAFANSFTVFITGNATASYFSNNAESVAAAGGTFVVGNDISNTTLITLSAGSANFNSGPNTSSTLISITGTSNVTIQKTVLLGSAGAALNIISSNNTITLNGGINCTENITVTPASNNGANVTVNCNGDILANSSGSQPGNAFINNFSIPLNTLNVTGNLRANGGSPSSAIVNRGRCTVTGELLNSQAAGNVNGAAVITNESSGILDLITNNLFLSMSMSPGWAGDNYGVINYGGIVNVTANNIIGSDSNNLRVSRTLFNSSGSMTINANNVIGGAASGLVPIIHMGGYMRVNANTLQARPGACISNGNDALVEIRAKNINFSFDGNNPILATRYSLIPPGNSSIRYAKDGTGIGSNAYFYQFTQDNFANFLPLPTPSQVRAGVTYASGTGTLHVPPVSAVAYGIVYDSNGSQTGIAFNSANIAFATPIASINTPDSIGVRLKKAATIEAVGHLLASFSN